MNRSLLATTISGVLALLSFSAPSRAHSLVHLHLLYGGPGELTVNGSRVEWAEVANEAENFQISCGDFLVGAYVSAEATGGLIPTPEVMSLYVYGKKYDFGANFGSHVPIKELSNECIASLKRGVTNAEDRENGVREKLERLGGNPVPALPQGVKYPVVRNVLTSHGKVSRSITKGAISVKGLVVYYSDSTSDSENFTVACSDLKDEMSSGQHSHFKLVGREFDDFREKKLKSTFPSADEVSRGISAQCEISLQEQARRETKLSALELARQEAETAEGLAKAAKAGAEQRRAEAKDRSEKQAAFHDNILKIWHAAEERDAFASLRGSYNLKSSDSLHWTATLNLVGADECYILRSAAAATIKSWTYVCQFPSGSYEGLVNSIQSILGTSYQPDPLAAAASVNQVFFSDPSKPDRRLVLTNMLSSTPSLVLLRVGATSQVSGPPELAWSTPSRTSASSSIASEIAAVARSGRYTALPTPISQNGAVTPTGTTRLNVQNDTAYTLTVLVSGPQDQRIEIASHSSASANLTSGTYQVLGRVNAANVLPSYGEYKLSGAVGIRFFVQ